MKSAEMLAVVTGQNKDASWMARAFAESATLLRLLGLGHRWHRLLIGLQVADAVFQQSNLDVASA